MSKTKCTNCGEPTSNKKFCSRKCVYDHRRIERSCKHCGIAIERNKTVCQDCNPRLIDWSNITLQDMKEERTYQKHSRIRERARIRYSKSNRPRKCTRCGYDKHFDVCHIKEVHEFDETTTVAEINDLGNLVALCKNCHWELDNGYLDYQKGQFYETSPPETEPKNTCIGCEKPISVQATRCQRCYAQTRTKADWPSNEELKKLVWEMPAYKVGKKFEVSGRAVKKRCDVRGIETPGRGYWQKKKRAGKLDK